LRPINSVHANHQLRSFR